MNYNDMEKLPIFSGLNAVEIRCICDCFGAQVKTCNRGEVVTSGRDGKSEQRRRYFAVNTETGEYIGIHATRPVNITAQDRLTLLWIPFAKLSRHCAKACSAHAKLSANFMEELSAENLRLQERLDCLTRPNTREKALYYLTRQMSRQSCEIGEEFKVESRVEMAEYMGVQPNALSRELAGLKNSGVIDFYKNRFKILC